VYHISLDFAHEDTPKLTDALMVEIAREYMRRITLRTLSLLSLMVFPSLSTLLATICRCWCSLSVCDRLRGKDKVKYQIYDAIKAALPCCNCWSDLCDIDGVPVIVHPVGHDMQMLVFPVGMAAHDILGVR